MTETTDLRDTFRAAILRGDYAAKQRLVESELAEEYSTSRFIVHNALLQLAGEGLVEIQQNRGARVRAISLEEAIEITDLREVVEGLIAAHAAKRITDAEVGELRELGDAMRQAVSDLEISVYAGLADDFHRRLSEISGHRTAVAFLNQLNAQQVRQQFRLTLARGRPVSGLEKHLAIIDAVCSRDSAAAEELMREHLSQVRQTLIASTNAKPSPASGRVALSS